MKIVDDLRAGRIPDDARVAWLALVDADDIEPLLGAMRLQSCP